MSISISNMNIFDKREYLETYISKGSEKYNNIKEQFNSKELIGFYGENSVSSFSVVIDTDKGTIVSDVRDKYSDKQMPNHKEAKKEIESFLMDLQTNMVKIDIDSDFAKTFSNAEARFKLLSEALRESKQPLDMDARVVDLDFSDLNNFTVSLDNPIISTPSLFDNDMGYKEVESFTLSDLETYAKTFLEEKDALINFEKIVSGELEKTYPNNTRAIERAKNEANNYVGNDVEYETPRPSM